MEDKITTKTNLVRRGICMTTNMCCLCGEEEETTSYLFCTRRVAWLVWSKCFELMGVTSTEHREPKKHFESFKTSGVKKTVNKIWGCACIVVVGECGYIGTSGFKGVRIDHMDIFTLAQMKAW